ncbi:MAG: ParB N-terminal domain-containing protein [Nitrososphaerota archaeon]|nr:ParB N-terminal domain-containing protein [Nitrososphaerota archaeon]
MNTITFRLKLVDIQKLREHEETDPGRLRRILAAIEADCVLKNPLVADYRTLVILDGVHRLNALRLIGCLVAPVCLVNYMSDDIVVYSKDHSTIINKRDVILAGFSDKKFPPRTTWHMIRTDEGLQHISSIEIPVNLPLAICRQNPTMGNMRSLG